MANFRDGNRRESRGGDRGRPRSGGFGGGRPGGRSGGSFNRSRGSSPEMHDAVCAKCGKDCQVPFRPSGDKPVLCRDCFSKSDSGSGRSFGPSRNFSSGNSRPSSSGMSDEQFKKLDEKLDKIIQALDVDSE